MLVCCVAVPIGRLICVSPFTSIAGMSQALFGVSIPGISYLTASHAWDNRAAVQTIGANCNANATPTVTGTPQPPAFTIIHGDRDEIVPYRMGEQLAADVRYSFPKWSQSGRFNFIQQKGGDHNTIFGSAYSQIAAAMTQPIPSTPPPATTATATASAKL